MARDDGRGFEIRTPGPFKESVCSGFPIPVEHVDLSIRIERP